MLRRWLSSIRSRRQPPLPSAYIASFLSGQTSHDKFALNIGDGWVGSDLADSDWLDRIDDIARRYNPEFPRVASLETEDAKAELRQLMVELRNRGQ